MKVGALPGGIFLCLAFAFSLLNVYWGYKLVQTEGLPADNHFILGVFTLILLSVSQLMLLKNSKSRIEESRNQKAHAFRLKAFLYGIASIGSGVLSLLTGTLSHAGQFPLLHAALGIAIVALIVTSGYQWIRCYGEFS